MIGIFEVGFQNESDLTDWTLGKSSNICISYNRAVEDFFGDDIINDTSDKLAEIMEKLCEDCVVIERSRKYVFDLETRLTKYVEGLI